MTKLVRTVNNRRIQPVIDLMIAWKEKDCPGYELGVQKMLEAGGYPSNGSSQFNFDFQQATGKTHKEYLDILAGTKAERHIAALDKFLTSEKLKVGVERRNVARILGAGTNVLKESCQEIYGMTFAEYLKKRGCGETVERIKPIVVPEFVEAEVS